VAITVQKGATVLVDDDQDVTITAVDLTRSYVLIDASTDSASTSTGYQDWGVTAYLSSPTTVRLQRDGYTVDAEVTWSVVTCDQGEFLTVERDSTSITTGNVVATAAVTETDPARTMLIYNTRGNFGTSDTRCGYATGRISSIVEVEFERGVSSTTRTNIRYELVEWSHESGVRVTAGVANVTTSADVELSFAHGASGVTASNTWCYSQSRHTQNGLEQCSMRVRFDAADILLKRYDQVAVYFSDVAWQLVTFPVDCCEQRTPVAASGDTTKDTTPTLVMDTASTIVWQTNNCNGTGTALGRNAWNVQVLNSTTVRQQRSYSGQASESAISICDFSSLNNTKHVLYLGHT